MDADEWIVCDLPDLTNMPLDELLATDDPVLLAMIDRALARAMAEPAVEVTVWPCYPLNEAA